MSLNPLSNPKGVKLLCELCQKPAFVQCTKCRVTYYCAAEHQRADWQGIHQKICQLLIPLRTPIPFLGSEEERQHRKQQQTLRQMQMIDLCRTEGQKLLFEGKYDQAVPAALQSLKFAIEVYGLASIELVPSYLILGEASIGLGHLSQAEEYLSQAQWTVVKTPECKDDVKSRLYRNLGLLYAAQGSFQEALKQLADDIYHSSLVYGTNDIHTSGGFFHMGNVFYQQNKLDIAFSLYGQVIDIWHDLLSRLVSQRTKTPAEPSGIGPAFDSGVPTDFETIDSAQEAEAVQVVNAILHIREQQQIQNPTIMTKIYFTMAMLHFVLGDMDKAELFCSKAKTACDSMMTADDSTARKIVELLQAIEQTNLQEA